MSILVVSDDVLSKGCGRRTRFSLDSLKRAMYIAALCNNMIYSNVAVVAADGYSYAYLRTSTPRNHPVRL